MKLARTTSLALAACVSGGAALADGTLLREPLLSDGANPSGLVLPDSTSVQASIDTDEKVGTVTGTFNLHPKTKDPTNQYFSVTVQSPLAQGQTYTNTSTLDGLTKSTSIAVQYAIKWGGFVRGSDQTAFKAAQPGCWRLVNAAAQAVPINGAHPPMPEETDAQKHSTCDDTSIKDALSKRVARDSDDLAAGRLSEKQIDDDNVRNAQDELTAGFKAWQKALNDKPAEPDDLWAISFNGKVGYEQHMYYDPTTLAKDMTNKTPWQVGVLGSWVPKETEVSLNLSFKYQMAFLDSDFGMTQTKCINSGATCVNGFIGAPTLQQKGLISGDVRWIRKIGDISLGLDPGVTYDAINDAEAVQFPIYLVSNTDNKLMGGIRYDWTSATHVSTVGVFVSTTAFSIFE